jgi:exopolysaccharide biosynthesis polyprenyl glycosylphosphotransferase
MGTDSATAVPRARAPHAYRHGAAHRGDGDAHNSPRVARFLQAVRWTDMGVALVALLAAFVITNVGRMPGGFTEFLSLRLTVKNLLLLVAFAAAWRLVCSRAGLYRWEVIRDRRGEAMRVLVAASVGSAAALVFPAISVTGAFRPATVLVSLAGAVAAMLVARTGLRTLIEVDADERHAILIVGTGPRGRALGHQLGSLSSARLVGYVDAAGPATAAGAPEPYLGDLGDLERILLAHAVDEVHVALPMRSRYAEIETALEICERTGVPAKWLADVFESTRGRQRFEVSAGGGVISITGEREHGPLMAKRLIDLVGATVGLVLLAPVLALAALAIKMTSPGPVLYRQDRYGLYRRRFAMYKLRTMVQNAEALQGSLEERNEASGPVFKIKDDPRITPVGRFLRRTSLDELPQLCNVLRGEMSLVGPRPLPLRDVGRFTEAALVRRFSVRPGLTGLWQISGRSNLAFERWAELDLRYIDDWSLGLDLKILLKTVPAVITGAGAS